MEPKIAFGVDYLATMALANTETGQDSRRKAYSLAKFMLCWEWAFTAAELAQVTKAFDDSIKERVSAYYPSIAQRLVSHLKENEQAKSRFMTDMMMVIICDGRVLDQEKTFIIGFAKSLGYEISDLREMAERAEQLVAMLNQYTGEVAAA